MNLYEYQAKELFREAGIPVPGGILLQRGEAWQNAVRDFSYPCVAKAQMLQGKRGKAGLVRLCNTGEAAEAAVSHIFAAPQAISATLLEEAVDFVEELYLSLSIDPVRAEVLVMACREGGMEIEELAEKTPEKIQRLYVPLERGIQPYQCRELGYGLGLNAAQVKQFIPVLTALFGLFLRYDAELLEVNPLFLTREGGFVCGDGKCVIDEAALPRQPRFEKGRDYFESDSAYEAYLEGIPYLQFDGDISLMCAGAGLTTTVYDLVNYAGGSVANYLEFGGPNYKKAVRAMELCLQNTGAKVILIVTFGTIARADVMAEGIRDAIEKLHPQIPIVTCIRGTNEEKATEILRDCGLVPIFDTEQAVEEAVRIAKEAR